MSFLAPKIKAAPLPPPPPPPTPLPDPTDAAARQAQSDALDSLRRRRGRSATILSGNLGDVSAPPRQRRQLGYNGGS